MRQRDAAAVRRCMRDYVVPTAAAAEYPRVRTRRIRGILVAVARGRIGISEARHAEWKRHSAMV